MTDINIHYREGRRKMPPKDELTEGEMEVATMVFKQYEKGVREACINAKVRIFTSIMLTNIG